MASASPMLQGDAPQIPHGHKAQRPVERQRFRRIILFSLKRLLCRRKRFRACGGVRSLNRRGQRPLVSADSFGLLFVDTGDESLTPQRAFRSLSLRFRLPPSADSPLARRRPLETFGAVPLMLYC